MKALVSALALLSFVAATTVPAVVFAQDAASTPAPTKKSTPAKKTAKHSKATKTKTAPAEKSTDEKKAN
jgi:hypothetical protein